MPHIAGKIRRKHAVEVDDLPELRGCGCKQVSIETAQSKLDCSVLAQLDDKQIMVGCIDLSDMTIETPRAGGRAHPSRVALCGEGARDPGARLRHEIPAARRGGGQVEGDGGGGADAASGVRGKVKGGALGRPGARAPGT